MGLVRNFAGTRDAPPHAAARVREIGLAVVLSGSCSRTANRQLAFALQHMPGFAIDPGVLALTTSDGLRLTLKSGNFGAEDFYLRAVRSLEGT